MSEIRGSILRTMVRFYLLAFCLSSVAIPQAGVVKPDEKTHTSKYGFYVTDGKESLVSEITNEDLVIYVDGKRFREFEIKTAESPLLTLIAVDNSGSMRFDLGDIIASAKSIVDSGNSDELTSVIRFVSSDRIELVTGFTSDKRRLHRGLDSLYVEGGATALVDAIYTGVESVDVQSETSTGFRPSIIVISDGEERDSFYNSEQLLKLLKEKGVRVVFVGLLKGLNKKQSKKSVELIDLIVNAGAGFALYPEKISDFSAKAPSILTALRKQRYLELRGIAEGAKIEIGLSNEYSKKMYKVYSHKLDE